jgi:acetylornithine deacetylase/succinyl-diaminopimelate desuccinylase family protein
MKLEPLGLSEHVDRRRLTDRLARLVSIESENPPGREAEVAAATADYCRDLGLEVEVHELDRDRPSVVARWRGGPGPTVGYCSHLDVVPAGDRGAWGRDPYGAEIADGRMFGRGSSDAKGPMAAALEAIAVLRESGFEPSGTLELALVADEESGGFKGAAFLVEEKLIQPEVAIVGEPSALRIVRAQRGIAWSRITTKGVAAHGSAPERGVNAIVHMAAIVGALQEKLPDITHPVVGGPTIGVGTIHGGDKVNMIPALCVAEIDRRTIPGETEEQVLAQFEAAIEKARATHPDVDATPEIVSWGSPFELRADAPLVETLAVAVAEVTGRDAEQIGFRGTSDARFLAEAGADVVVFGPGEIELAHTARESIDLDQLETGALCYALAFARLLGAS